MAGYNDSMIVGVDLDNTIVCYDAVIHRSAAERGWIPAGVPPTKRAVRDALRQAGREDDWTELQGYVYGPGMATAVPFPGVEAFLRRCRQDGITVLIISHRTPHPFRGPAHDLHAAARAWLERQGFFDPDGVGLVPERVHLESTKEAKLERIRSEGCRFFVDDLPEFLSDPSFPAGVGRILFDPNGEHPVPPGVHRAATWSEIENMACGPHPSDDSPLGRASPFRSRRARPEPRPPRETCDGATDDDMKAMAAPLLENAGLRGPASFRPLPGGANNRVYRVDTAGGPALLKAYFRHPDDPRDRQGAEYAFARFAWDRGIRAAPRPLGCDPARGLSLFEFIEGRPLRPEEVTAPAVAEALALVRDVNRHRADPAAGALPDGSEACFSPRRHLECVENRVRRLDGIEDLPGAHREAVAFVRRDLAPAWAAVRRAAQEEACGRGLSLDEAVPLPDRCLSPSDFGFHNALRAPDGRLRFFDFEYAGWDDPAKLACDFFCQPRVPVPREHWTSVLDAAAAVCGNPDRVRLRAAWAFPVYRLKWCCIRLNDFLSAGGDRRRFAGAPPSDAHKAAQLRQARDALRSLQEETPP